MTKKNEKEWIKDKDRCWICKRTKKEVIDNSNPDGELFKIDGSKEDLINSAFVDYDIAGLYCKIPICKICYHFISMIALEIDDNDLRDEIVDDTINKIVKKLES